MAHPNQPLIVYRASASGLREVILEMVRGARHGIYPGLQIFKGGILSNYRSSLLGIFWDIVAPLFLGLIFIFMYNSRAIGIGEVTIPYPVFVIIGVMVWQCFADALTASMDSIRKDSNILKHVKTYPESIMYSIVFKVGFNTIFRVLVVISICVFFGVLDWIGLLGLLVVLPIIMLPGFVFGFILAPISLFFGDISRATSILLTPLMFLSGAIFPIESRLPALQSLTGMNPISMLLTESRSLVTGSGFVNIDGVLVVGSSFAVGLLLAWYFFHISLKLAVERI